MRGTSFGLLILAGIGYGAALPLAKIAGGAGVAALGYVFWQSAGAFLLLGLCRAALRRGQPRHAGPFPVAYYLVCGILGIVVPNLVLFRTLQVLPVGLVALIVVTVPLITVAICGLAGWERWSRTRIFGVLLGFFGAALILMQDGGLPPIRSALWISVALIAPLSLAVCGIYAARARPEGMTPVGAATGMLGVAAAVLGPLAAATGQFHVPDAAFGLGQQAVAAQIVISSFCYLLYFRILRTDGPVYFSQVGYVIVASGLIWGAVLYGEALNPAAIAAGVLIVLGLVVVHRGRLRPGPDTRIRPGMPRPQFARSNSKQL